MQPDPDFIRRPLAYKSSNRLWLSYSVKIEKKNIRFRFVMKKISNYCSSRFYVDIVFLLSFYHENDFSNQILHRTSYDHSVIKTYFFMHTFSDINAVISCKTKELSHLHLWKYPFAPQLMICDEHVVNIYYIYLHRRLQYIMTETVAHM